MRTTLFQWISKLASLLSGLGTSGRPSESFPSSADLLHNAKQKPLPISNVAWGSHPRVSHDLMDSAAWTCLELMPKRDLSSFMSDMLSCMAFETGETFDPGIKNMAGSGATGLIQFMPQTAIGLGVTTAKLAAMSQSEQMAYVYKYFKPYKNRLHNIGDVYLAIFYPAAMSKPDDHVIFSIGTKGYEQNKGLDRAKKGYFTRADAVFQAQSKLEKGLRDYSFSGHVNPYK